MKRKEVGSTTKRAGGADTEVPLVRSEGATNITVQKCFMVSFFER
jgi:hypothetical protein